MRAFGALANLTGGPKPRFVEFVQFVVRSSWTRMNHGKKRQLL